MNSDFFNVIDKLRVKLLAFPAAEPSVYDKYKKKYISLFNPEQVEFVNNNPEVLMFLSGGAERSAIESVQEYRFYLVLASKNDNSWAAATETVAWMSQHNISTMLVNAESPEAPILLSEYYKAVTGVKRLHGQRLGVVGSSSEWLVASAVSPFQLQSKMGIEQVDIAWSDIVFDEVAQVSSDFMALFGNTGDKKELFESGKVYEGLASLIPFYKLNSLSVECFPMVNKTSHTACLALAKLNYDGISAACEADNTSAAGMMFASEVCGFSPWMANTIFVETEKAVFAHCTVPMNLVSDFKLDTHFETNKGLAVAGNIKGEAVTIFRFNNTFTKMFIAEADVVSRPQKRVACRTQLEVKITPSATKYFLEYPFGNHHLILPGKFAQRLKLAAKLLQMEVVE